MRNALIVCSIIFLCCLAIGWAAGSGSGGNSAGYMLTEVTSARAAALGGSFGSVEGDATSVKFNPAALGTISRSQCSFMYDKDLLSDTFMNFTGGFIVGQAAIAVSADYYDAGVMKFYDVGWNEKLVSAETDKVFGLSYAGAVIMSDSPLYYGLTLKYFSSTLVEYKTAIAGAGDAGLLYPIPGSSLTIGLSALNFGTKLKYINVSESLPSSARFSIRLRISSFFIITDADYLLYDRACIPSVGLEYSAGGVVAVRGGYKFNSIIDKLSCGVGINLKRLNINYSYGIDKMISVNSQKISVDIFFTGIQ